MIVPQCAECHGKDQSWARAWLRRARVIKEGFSEADIRAETWMMKEAAILQHVWKDTPS